MLELRIFVKVFLSDAAPLNANQKKCEQRITNVFLVNLYDTENDTDGCVYIKLVFDFIAYLLSFLFKFTAEFVNLFFKTYREELTT